MILAWRVEKWGAAAVFGSEAAPLQLLEEMTAVSNIYDAVTDFFGKYTGPNIHRMPASISNIIVWLRTEGYM